MQFILVPGPLRPQALVDTDDAQPLGGFRVDEDYAWRALYQSGWKFIQAVTDDETLSPAGGFRTDEDYRWVAQYQTVPPLPPVVITDDETLSPLGGFRIDEDYCWRPLYQAQSPYARAIVDDDLPAFNFEDDYWWRASYQLQWQYLPALTDDEIGASLGGFRLDEEYCGQLTQSQWSYRWPSWPDDEVVAQAAAPQQFDEDWWSASGQSQWRYASALIDDEALSPLGGFRTDEDYWWCGLYQAQWLYRGAIVDDDLPAFAFDEDYLWWWPASQRQWLYSPAIIDDEVGAALGGFRLDEDYWQALVQLGWAYQALRLFDEEDLAQQQAQIVDEETWFALQFPPSWPVSQSVADDEVLPSAGGFRLDEDYWIARFQAQAALTPQALVDDELWVQPPAAFPLDEEYWLQLFRIQALSLIQPITDDDVWVEFVPEQPVVLPPPGVGPEDVAFDEAHRRYVEELTKAYSPRRSEEPQKKPHESAHAPVEPARVEVAPFGAEASSALADSIMQQQIDAVRQAHEAIAQEKMRRRNAVALASILGSELDDEQW